MQEQVIKVSVIIPAYNEEQAISRVLEELIAVMDSLKTLYEIIVVDDGSTDNTRALAERYPRVRVIAHSENRGPGAARTTGVRQARGQYVVMIDADGTYPVAAIPRLLEELSECDMVIGARDREAGTWPWLRALAKDAIRALASYLMLTKIPVFNSLLFAMACKTS